MYCTDVASVRSLVRADVSLGLSFVVSLSLWGDRILVTRCCAAVRSPPAQWQAESASVSLLNSAGAVAGAVLLFGDAPLHATWAVTWEERRKRHTSRFDRRRGQSHARIHILGADAAQAIRAVSAKASANEEQGRGGWHGKTIAD